MNSFSFSLIFPLLVLFASGASGLISGDLNCTELVDGVWRYTAAAVSCNNVISDEACQTMYPEGETDGKFPTAGGKQQRSFYCYSYDDSPPAEINIEMKKAAVATCPKTCGLCCQTEQFAPLFNVNCSDVKPASTAPPTLPPTTAPPTPPPPPTRPPMRKIKDDSCTKVWNEKIVFDYSAFSCSDELGKSVCDSLYPPVVPGYYPAVEDNVPRPTNCHIGANGYHSEALKTAAIQKCAKTCAYCCKRLDRG